MPLHRKMIILTLVLFGLLIGLVYALQFTHTRDYLARQMLDDVSNNLNALGLSLRPHLENDDLAAVQTTINAVFDAGSFREIRFVRLSDGAEVSREQNAPPLGVPEWFVDLNLFEPVRLSNSLTSGWLQLGDLTVVGDPAPAYEQLWKLSVQILLWFGVAALCVVLLLLYTIRRLFRPLAALEARANEIAEQKFSHPLPEPDLVELRGLVRAFNRMARKLQTIFYRQAEEAEKLRAAAYQDPLTGLGNRAWFQVELEQWLGEEGSGGLVLLQLYQLKRISDEQGYDARDELVQAVAEQLRALRRERPWLICARTHDDEFALISVGEDPEAFRALVEELDLRMIRTLAAVSGDLGRMHAIGAVLRAQETSARALLAAADAAVKQAWMGNAASWRIAENTALMPVFGRQQWRKLITDAVARQQLAFKVQPVLRLDGSVRELELFSAIRQQGHLYPAAQFMPFVEQYDLGPEYDRSVLEQVAPQVGPLKVPLMVNLSESAVGSVAFVSWLGEWLESDPSLRRRIGFELPEASLASQQGGLRVLARLFNRHRVRFGFDRIGRHIEQLKLLAELEPDYMKVDRSLVLCSEEADRGFLKALARLVHDLDIDLIAVRIENEDQISALGARAIDGYQGFVRPPLDWKPGQKLT